MHKRDSRIHCNRWRIAKPAANRVVGRRKSRRRERVNLAPIALGAAPIGRGKSGAAPVTMLPAGILIHRFETQSLGNRPGTGTGHERREARSNPLERTAQVSDNRPNLRQFGHHHWRVQCFLAGRNARNENKIYRHHGGLSGSRSLDTDAYIITQRSNQARTDHGTHATSAERRDQLRRPCDIGDR